MSFESLNLNTRNVHESKKELSIEIEGEATSKDLAVASINSGFEKAQEELSKNKFWGSIKNFGGVLSVGAGLGAEYVFVKEISTLGLENIGPSETGLMVISALLFFGGAGLLLNGNEMIKRAKERFQKTTSDILSLYLK